MEYTYMISFKIDGISLPKATNEVVVSELDTVRVLLCTDISKYSLHIDRGLAASKMMLKGVTGQNEQGEFEDRLNIEVESIKKDRNKRYPKGTFLVFEARGTTAVNLSKSTRDYGPFVITFDAVEKELIKAQYKKLINQHLTSLFLLAERDFRVNKVFDGLYLEKDSKVYYSFTISGSATAIVTRDFTDESTEKLKKYFSKLNKNTSLDNINRLLVRASSEQADKLKSFIFAWTALEVFFNKTFNFYEEKFLEKHTVEALPELAQLFFDRIKDVMKGKYSLKDKFIVIASMLSNDTEEDLQNFLKVKKARDRFLHGEDIEENELPTNNVIYLVHKYLALHLIKIES